MVSVCTSTRIVFNEPSTLKVPECLSKLERLNDDSLLLLVVSNLGVTGKREVLSQRVTIETVIGHDSPQVGVTAEEDTKQIPDLTLVPVCTVVERSDRRDRGGLVGVRLDADARVVAHREHVVDDFESLAASGEVDCGDVAHLSEFGGCVVFEELEDGNDTLWGNVDGEFILPNGEPARLNHVR